MSVCEDECSRAGAPLTATPLYAPPHSPAPLPAAPAAHASSRLASTQHVQHMHSALSGPAGAGAGGREGVCDDEEGAEEGGEEASGCAHALAPPMPYSMTHHVRPFFSLLGSPARGGTSQAQAAAAHAGALATTTTNAFANNNNNYNSSSNLALPSPRRQLFPRHPLQNNQQQGLSTRWFAGVVPAAEPSQAAGISDHHDQVLQEGEAEDLAVLAARGAGRAQLRLESPSQASLLGSFYGSTGRAL